MSGITQRGDKVRIEVGEENRRQEGDRAKQQATSIDMQPFAQHIFRAVKKTEGDTEE